MRTGRLSACLVLTLAVLMCACVKKPSTTADVPRLLPATYKISVAPFTQPRNPYHLIAGQIPKGQGQIPQDDLIALDRALKNVLLADTKRKFDFIKSEDLPASWNESRSTVQPGALGRWVEYARERNTEYLLVPQILDWHEREGSEAGVTSSAHVRVEFYLINVERGAVQDRSIFEEKQVGLVDNLLKVGEFVKRKGQWVTATDLTVEGMKQAVKELDL